MRALLGVMIVIVLAQPAMAQTVLKREPHYLAPGAVAFVDSGQCGAGRVMKVTGAAKGAWRRKVCLVLNPREAALQLQVL